MGIEVQYNNLTAVCSNESLVKKYFFPMNDQLEEGIKDV